MKRFRLRYADWSWREYAAAAVCVVRGRVAAGPHAQVLARRLNDYYAPSTAYALDFGHTALRIALDVFQARRPGRKTVIVPGYICPSVVDTVRAAGLVPKAAEVGRDLNIDAGAVRAAIGPDTLAVVAPHMFGCPAAVDELEQLCREAGVFLVDDAAQVVGERRHGRLLGSFGDAGIVSFAQSKAVVTGIRGSGGVLLVNNPELDPAVKAICAALPPAAGRFGALLDFVWNYQWKALTGNSGYYLSRLRGLFGRTRRAAPSMAAIGNLDAAIALEQFARLDTLRREKVRVAEAYQQALAGVPGVSLPQYAPGRYLSRIMVALPPHADLARLRAELGQAGVDTRMGYLNAVVPGEPDSPQVAAARKLIGLPFSSALQNDAINKICSILTKCLPAQALPVYQNANSNEPHQTAHQR
ncbi:DegT/DnrJ/EryC1/StrS family aminotransferase [Massilia sp. DD77]|uniref:DegT/DnrJ/EryC1/StrS family aminotransferase n=1 Tax=Massilia sp. DD77 TaxID=3109349 RepID=UPI002FFFACD5